MYEISYSKPAERYLKKIRDKHLLAVFKSALCTARKLYYDKRSRHFMARCPFCIVAANRFTVQT